MELYAWIKGHSYPVANGSGFDEQLNETLDSGNIILPHISEVLDIKPYDDIWVYEQGFPITVKDRFKNLEAYTYAEDNHLFYKHFIVGNFSREKTYLSGSTYTYTISLVSESKKLETCLMPNRTITQPKEIIEISSEIHTTTGGVITEEKKTIQYSVSTERNVIVNQTTVVSGDITVENQFYDLQTHMINVVIKKNSGGSAGVSYVIQINYQIDKNYRTIYEVCEEFVNSYGHQVRVATDTTNKYWSWTNEFILDDSLEDLFGNTMAPEMQFSSPTLRSALQQLFLVKDCLPILKDGVITYLDISARTNLFTSITGSSWEQYTMDASSYSDRLRRTYSNALSQNNTTHFIEKMGFRNTNSSTLTLENMRLEFTHPIYKISKMVLCSYYKVNGESRLYRFDITPLILQNSYRNLMSEDWSELESTKPTTIEELSKYKICTLGYDIGSKYITGWGDKYTYPVGWWTKEKSVIENIMGLFLDNNLPIISSRALLPMKSGVVNTIKTLTDNDSIISPAKNPSWVNTIDVLNFVDDFTQMVKTLFFECEYEGFIDGAVQISKDEHDGNVVINDNTASSLTIVEKDGLFEKEKANRLGNAAKVISARVSSLSNILSLGAYNSDDEIVYKITTNIEKDYISVSYYLCKDYVLKNYYTAVWSKERPFALASYGESVSREENKYLCLYLSEDKHYYQTSSNEFSNTSGLLKGLVSFFNDSLFDGIHLYNSININAPFISCEEYISNKYLVDTQIYTVGNALCSSITMTDNITAGNYIDRIKPTFGSYIQSVIQNLTDVTGNRINAIVNGTKSLGDITGSTQKWYKLTDSGYSYKIHFNLDCINPLNLNEDFHDGYAYSYGYTESDYYAPSNTEKITSGIYKTLFDYPKITTSNVIFDCEAEVNSKDNKEHINATFEFEPICSDYNIKISDNFLGMSDLNPNAKKFNDNVDGNGFLLYTHSHNYDSTLSLTISVPSFTLFFPREKISTSINIGKTFEIETYAGTFEGTSETVVYQPKKCSYTLGTITSIASDFSYVDISITSSSLNPNYSSDRYNDTFTLRLYNQRNYTVNQMTNNLFGHDYSSQIQYPVGIVEGYDSFTGAILTTKFRDNSGTVVDYKYGQQRFTTTVTTNEFYDRIRLIDNELGVYISWTSTALLQTSKCLRYDLPYSATIYDKNISWYLEDSFTKNDIIIPDTPSSSATSMIVTGETSDVLGTLTLRLFNNSIQNAGSIRCYIDNKFTFGANVDSSNWNAISDLTISKTAVWTKTMVYDDEEIITINLDKNIYKAVPTNVQTTITGALDASIEREILQVTRQFVIIRVKNVSLQTYTITLNLSYNVVKPANYMKEVTIYLSLMDTRSLSVYSQLTGDKVGEITNYIGSSKTYGSQNDYDSI